MESCYAGHKQFAKLNRLQPNNLPLNVMQRKKRRDRIVTELNIKYETDDKEIQSGETNAGPEYFFKLIF